MKASVKFIYDDYNKLDKDREKNNSSEEYFFTIEDFFDPSDERVNVLCNNNGSVYLDDLVEYIVQEMFPINGCWVSLDDKYKNELGKEKSIKIEQLFYLKLLESNFYETLTEVLRSCFMFNHSTSTVEYSAGLNFIHMKYPNLVASPGEGVLKRFYFKKKMELQEILLLFGGVPQEYLENNTDDDMYEEYEVIRGVVPHREPFFKREDVESSEYAYKDVYLFIGHGKEHLLTPKVSTKGYSSLPIINHQGSVKRSVCRKALVSAVKINSYEQQFEDRVTLSNQPPIAATQSLLDMNYDLRLAPNSLITKPTINDTIDPVESKLQFPIEGETFVRIDSMLRRIFRTNLIDQVKQIGATQSEYYEAKRLAIMGVYPTILTTTARLIKGLMTRTSALLSSEDDEFRSLVGGVVSFKYKYLTNLIETLHKIEQDWAIWTSCTVLGNCRSGGPV